MTRERWREIEDLYHAAVQLDPPARAALLEGTDPQLRHEVESLLAHDGSLPDLGLPVQPDAPAGVPLAPGSRLGPYRIENSLAAGGMGEVYRARDTQLDRTAAIKILPAALARDPEHMERFGREAKVLASLNHPNIAQVYAIVEGHGVRGIAMELVPGETISGPLPLKTAMHYARQIASALEAAHEGGIVHRDLKPANIMVKPDGVIKVLDFGLARITPTEHGDPPRSPTRTGLILGTAAYMSPEQARGKAVDKRTDIWAFGVVLYEILTGHRLFEGETVSDILASVLTREPDLRAAPAPWRRLIGRCLEKDPRKRLRDIGDWEELLDQDSPVEAAGPPGAWMARNWIPWAVAAIAILAGGAGWFLGPIPPAAPYEITPLTSFQGQEVEPALSPDGHHLAFVWAGEPPGPMGVYVKQISAGGEPLRVSPSDKIAENPSWSPDGNRLAYVRSGPNGMEILVAPALGGPERRIGVVSGTTPVSIAWSPDQKWIVAPVAGPGGGLTRIAIDTGEARQLTRVAAPGESHWSPRFSPDGKKLAYMNVTGNFNNVVFAADANPDGALTSKPKRVGSRLWYSFCLDWFPDSEHILMPSIRGAELQYWKVPLNGAPEVRLPLEFPVDGTTGYGAGHVLQSTVSLRGARLAAVVFRHASDIQRLECESSARACKPAPFYGSSRTDEEIHVSPNGQWVAFASTRSGSREIWRARLDGSGALQLTSMPEIRSGSPRWSPDSQWLGFDAPYLGRQAVYLVAAEGGTARRLTEGGSNARPGFSADGKWVYFAGSDDCIWKIPAAGGQLQKVTRTQAASAYESADGRWLYFFTIRPNRRILRMPAGGGEEQLVFQDPTLQTWALTDRAVFAGLFAPGQGSSIVRVELPSLQSREVYRFLPDNPRFNTLSNQSLAVAPGERAIYAIGGRSPEGDILMIDNFR